MVPTCVSVYCVPTDVCTNGDVVACIHSQNTYTHTYEYTCIYTYTYVPVYICICKYTYTCMYMYICMYTHVQTVRCLYHRKVLDSMFSSRVIVSRISQLWQIPLKMLHPRNQPNPITQIPWNKSKWSPNSNLNLYRQIPRNLSFSIWWFPECGVSRGICHSLLMQELSCL